MRRRTAEHTETTMKNLGIILLLFTISLGAVTLFATTYIVSPYPFSDLNVGHDNSNVTVHVPEAERAVVEQVYDPDVEEAFCMFGTSDRYHINVTEIIHVTDPMNQTEGSVSFSCLRFMKDELPSMLTDKDYKFLGHIHTHPTYPQISRPDSVVMAWSIMYMRVIGVYNGADLAFFSPRSLSDPLEETDQPL